MKRIACLSSALLFAVLAGGGVTTPPGSGFPKVARPRRLTIGSTLLLGLILASVVRPLPLENAQLEISHLLSFVAQSGCAFGRNGSWYDDKRAEAHLRSKYQALAARNEIHTAEDFIEKAASRSSFSGRPYEVRCQDKAALGSKQWLTEELRRYRATSPPRTTRGGLQVPSRPS